MAIKSKQLYLYIFILGLFIALQTLMPQEEQFLPKLSSRVVDNIDLLTNKQKSEIFQKLQNLDEKTNVEVVLVVVETTKPETIEGYSIRLANEWKIGKKNKDNGVILLIAKKDRKLRIEVGYGLEDILTDARSKQIISEKIVPSFKAGSYYAGINAGLDQIIYVIENRVTIVSEEKLAKEAALQEKIAQERKWKIWSYVKDFSYVWMVFCGLFAIFFLYKKKFYLGFALPAFLFGIPMFLLGWLYDDYFFDALFVIPGFLFFAFLLWHIFHSQSGGSYSGSGTYRSSSYSSSSSRSSYSSSSSSSGSSYSGGGGSFGGGGASGSW